MKKIDTKEPEGCVYHIVDLRNGRGYVGQHKNLLTVEHRWAAHVRLSNGGMKTPFHRALRKYKQHSFTWEVIWSGPRDLLNKKETYYIKKLHTFIDDPKGRGYNLTMGGESPNHCAASKKTLSTKTALRWENPHYRAEMTLQSRLLGADPAIRSIRSSSRKAFWAAKSPEERKLIGDKVRAKLARRTQEELAAQKLLSSAGAREQWQDPKFRKLQRDAITSWWNGMTREERTMRCENQREKSTKMWKQRTAKERAAIAASVSTAHNKKSQAEKTAIREKKRLGALRRYADTTKEERAAEWRRTHPNGNKSLTK